MPKADPLYLTPLLTARGAGPRQAEGTLSHMRGGGGGSYLGPTAERGGNGMLREPSCQRRSWPLGPASLCGHLALGCSLPELLWYADQDGACSYLLSYEHHTLLLAAAGRLGPRGPLPFHNPLTRTLPLPTSPPLHLILVRSTPGGKKEETQLRKIVKDSPKLCREHHGAGQKAAAPPCGRHLTITHTHPITPIHSCTPQTPQTPARTTRLRAAPTR